MKFAAQTTVSWSAAKNGRAVACWGGAHFVIDSLCEVNEVLDEIGSAQGGEDPETAPVYAMRLRAQHCLRHILYDVGRVRRPWRAAI